MSMRGYIGSAVIATLMAGCGVAGQVDDGSGGDNEGSLLINNKYRCPDPTTDCTVNNGTGVYFEEDGFAGLGQRNYMIQHFVNVAGGGVNVVVRYFDSGTGIWRSTTGSVYYANYGTTIHTASVVSVSETNTVPAWTIYDSSTGTNLTVGDSGLMNLQVVIYLDKLYTLSWDSVQTETDRASIRKYNMRWSDTGSAVVNQYCFRADSSKDQVVFQGGMAVNPVSAAVTRDAGTAGNVTVSCRYGAIATVRLWGYPYRLGTATYYYDSGLQMKRASYCADGNYYTHAGTKIRIWDDHGLHTDPMGPSEIEAWWSPTGATCIGPLRHSAMGFSGKCNGVPLPPCDAAATSHLADAASPPAL